MEFLILAERDFDWIEIIVVILVFGGSALGAIGKKLIKAFSPKEDVLPKKPPVVIQPATRQDAPAQRVEIPPPVARPTPAKPTSRPKVIPPPVARPARPKPIPQATTTPRRSKVGKRTVRVPTSQTTRKRAPGALRHLEPTVDDHLDELGSDVKARTSEVDATVDKHIGHLKPRVASAPTTGQRSRAHALLGPTSGMNRGAIRRAVLLREILGPPVSLRPRDETF